MIYRKVGFWAALIFMLVSLGQVHEMVPGLRFLRLGSLTSVVLYAVVAIEIRNLNWSPMVIWRLLFFLSLTPGLLFGYDLGATLLVVRGDFAGVFAFFLGALLFFRTLDDLRKVQAALIVLCAALSVWTLTHGGRGPGMLGDENDVAMAIVMLLPFPFFKLFDKIRPSAFLLYLLIFFAGLAAVAASLSRGGMVGALAVLGACWLKTRHKSATLMIFLVLLIAVVFLSPEQLVKDFMSIGDTQEETADERFFFWKLSWEMFLKRPLFGVGADAWGSAAWSGLVSTGGRWFHNMTPHSVYFQLMSELGFFGLVTWVGLLIVCLLCFRDILPGRLKQQGDLALMEGAGPGAARQIQERQKFMSHFGLSTGIGLLGFLTSGAFLSLLYYPMFFSFAALLQASKESWRRELRVFSLLNRKRPETVSGGVRALPAATRFLK